MLEFILPSLHPAFTMHGNARFMGVLQHDFRRAKKLLDGYRPQWTDDGFTYRPTLKQVRHFVAKCLKKKRGVRVAYDCETNGKHALACELRCLGLFNGQEGIVIPFLYRDGGMIDVPYGKVGKTRKVPRWVRFYGEADEREILLELQKLFEAGRKGQVELRTQNGQFDRIVLKSCKGLDAPQGKDTIVDHHLVASFFPHGLGFLGSLYTDVVHYKSTEEGESWSSKSDEQLWLYCGRDCRVTWIAEEELEKEVTRRAEDIVLREHDYWGERNCQAMKEVGVKVDRRVLARLRKFYKRLASRALAKMREIVRDRVSDEEFESFLNLAKVHDDEGNPIFRPRSLPELRTVLGALGIPLTALTATGELSTAKDFLLDARMEMLAQNVDPDDPRIAFLDYLFAYRENDKIAGTFLTPEILSDGRLHPTYSVHVTPTGRLASKRPNFQNQPKEVRGMFVAEDGYELVMGDWDSLELRLSAIYSGEPVLTEAFRLFDAGKGPKVHYKIAEIIFNKTKEHITDALYRSAKAFVYGTCIEGGTPVALLNGAKPIRDVKAGDWTYCWDGEKYAQTMVSQVYYMGCRPCLCVKIRNGSGRLSRIIVTRDHVMLMSDSDRKQAGNLMPGDTLMPFRRRGLSGGRATVVSVKPAGTHPIYCLHVEHPAHNFALEGTVFVDNCYGAGPKTLYEMLLKEMPDLKYKAFLECYENFKKGLKVLFAWQRKLLERGMANRYLESPVMKRRSYYFERRMQMGGGDIPDSPEAARMLNFPNQSGAYDIVSQANRRINETVLPKYKGARQVAQIHDELVYEVKKGQGVKFKKDFERVAKSVLPAGWVLPVNVEVGHSWGKVPKAVIKMEAKEEIKTVPAMAELREMEEARLAA